MEAFGPGILRNYGHRVSLKSGVIYRIARVSVAALNDFEGPRRLFEGLRKPFESISKGCEGRGNTFDLFRKAFERFGKGFDGSGKRFGLVRKGEYPWQ